MDSCNQMLLHCRQQDTPEFLVQGCAVASKQWHRLRGKVEQRLEKTAAKDEARRQADASREENAKKHWGQVLEFAEELMRHGNRMLGQKREDVTKQGHRQIGLIYFDAGRWVVSIGTNQHSHEFTAEQNGQFLCREIFCDMDSIEGDLSEVLSTRRYKSEETCMKAMENRMADTVLFYLRA